MMTLTCIALFHGVNTDALLMQSMFFITVIVHCSGDIMLQYVDNNVCTVFSV